MKFRLDFVTNSSSSSYTCDVCGNVEAGYDLCMSDAEMSECENGHIMCDYHILTKAPHKEMAESILLKEIAHLDRTIASFIASRDKYEADGRVFPAWQQKSIVSMEEYKAIYVPWLEQLQFNKPLDEYVYDYQALYEYLLSNVDDIKLPAQACPLCSFEDIADYDIKQYLMVKYGINKPELLEELKNMFGSYQEFITYTKPKSIER